MKKDYFLLVLFICMAKTTTLFATDANIRITAERQRALSVLKLIENPITSSAYVQGEDARLLMLDESMTPFAIYSIDDSNNQALCVDVRPQIEFVPIAVHVIDGSDTVPVSVKLTFSGVEADSIRDFFIYDSYIGAETILTDDSFIELEDPGSDVVRYFIGSRYMSVLGSFFPTDIDNVQTQEIVCYAENGKLQVQSPQEIGNLCIFTLSGQMIYGQSIHAATAEVPLLQGVYVVVIDTPTGRIIRKIVIG